MDPCLFGTNKLIWLAPFLISRALSDLINRVARATRSCFAKNPQTPRTFIHAPPAQIPSSDTSFESSSTHLHLHILNLQCLPRRLPVLPRRRRLPPLRLMPHTKVCTILVGTLHHNAVASLRKLFYRGRIIMLTSSYRYDQGCYPYCKFMPACWRSMLVSGGGVIPMAPLDRVATTNALQKSLDLEICH